MVNVVMTTVIMITQIIISTQGHVTMIRKKAAVILAILLLLFINLPQAYSKTCKCKNTQVKASVSDYRLTAINIDWWDNFTDPYLKENIYKAVQNNHELKMASLKTKEYQQMVKVAFAKELPSVTLSPSYAFLKTPGFDLDGLDFKSSSTSLFALPLLTSYEADIFLKNHDKTKAAKKQYEASKFEEKAIYISLASSVATTYLNIVKLDKTISLQEQIVAIRKQIFDLTKERNKAGLASTYDVTNTDKLHTTALIALNDLKKERALLIHQLAVFVADSPCEGTDIKISKFEEIEFRGKIPAQISSQIVINRPDIMKAEKDLEKAKIDVRVARKDFLPTIPLIGSVGYSSIELSRLFDARSFFGLIGVAAMQSLYTGGKKMATLRVKKIQYEQLFENYKQTDLQAMQEINDSLSKIKFDTTKDNENFKKYNLEKSNFGLINERYKAGIISYLEMIQYKENLLGLEREKSDSKIQRYVDYISLYKSVGGCL